MNRFIISLLCSFILLSADTIAEQSCDVMTLMSPEVQQLAGVDRLSADEIKALNQWFLKYCLPKLITAQPPVNSSLLADGFESEQASVEVLVEQGAIQISSTDAFGLEQKLSNKVQSIESTVSAVSKNPHGRFVVTLSNGQRWRQRETKKIKVKINDPVVISVGVFGSYNLKHVPTKRVTKVRRVD